VNLRELAPFLLILLLAGLLRLAGITSDSLWLDEGYQTMTEATGQPLPDFFNAERKAFLFRYERAESLPVVLANFKNVDPLCPPLYAVLLNRWMHVFGTQDFAVRAMSALLSTISVAGTFLIARGLFGLPAAICAASLHAISPFDIYYAQEARMYSLAVLSAIISGGTLSWLLFAQGRLRPVIAVAYSAATCALINSHYTGLFTVAFEGLFSLWYCIRYRFWNRLAWLTGCWLGVLLLWLPWFDIFRHAAGNRTASFYVSRPGSLWWPFYALFIRMPVNWLTYLSGKQVIAYAIPIYVTAAALVANAVAFTRRQMNVRIAFLWAWAILPAMLLWIIDVVESRKVIEISRYTITTAPAIYLLCGIAAAVMLRTRKWFKWILIAHAVFALVNIIGTHVVEQREPWKQLAQTVENKVGTDDLVLVSQYYNIACLDRYLTKPYVQVGISPALGAKYFADAISGRDRFWLITAQEGEAITSYVPRNYKLDSRFDFRHGLHLRYYERLPYSMP
jgi:uncharacterized membrane protein